MKPKNTEPQTERQRALRRGAVRSAVFHTAVQLVSAAVVLWVRAGLDPAGFFAKLLLVIIVLDIGGILPVWISLKARLKEIEGGEEDAAAQY